MVDNLPSNEVHHEPSGLVVEKLEDLLNQEALEPVTTYKTNRRQFGRSISPERQLEAQLWNHIHSRADLPTSHGC